MAGIADSELIRVKTLSICLSVTFSMGIFVESMIASSEYRILQIDMPHLTELAIENAHTFSILTLTAAILSDLVFKKRSVGVILSLMAHALIAPVYFWPFIFHKDNFSLNFTFYLYYIITVLAMFALLAVEYRGLSGADKKS